MILPDANLLIYAVNRDAPHHQAARTWLEQVLSGTTGVGLPWLVLIAFIRLTTNPRIFESPLSPEAALDIVSGWLEQPCVVPVGPGDRHWLIFSRLLRRDGTAGNLTNDAHLAALAIEYDATLYSADNDFRRFEGLDYVNPLAPGNLQETREVYSS
ncbi:type II toxin-antitoxin system VapC family toxin [Wenzhouxiangella sp. EGI_FJ10305]|uniref:type II toxin-antitoxin system VapC family toxin n=1 Tax=Wenzhouxiangella sp. EGI_FJ10305 TaxID=3243768 RepID=UPI0035DF333D